MKTAVRSLLSSKLRTGWNGAYLPRAGAISQVRLDFLPREEDVFAADFLFGTFAPSFRASESPIAIACLRLVTFFPLRPLFSVPLFFSRIARSTLLPASGLYFLPADDFFDEVFLAAMQYSPFRSIGKRGAKARLRAILALKKNGGLTHAGRGRKNVLHIDPLRRVVARVAGNAKAIAFAPVACFL